MKEYYVYKISTLIYTTTKMQVSIKIEILAKHLSIYIIFYENLI